MGRLGEQRYNLLFNNCEHFAHWCKTGRHRSNQVEDWIHTGSLGALALGQFVPRGPDHRGAGAAAPGSQPRSATAGARVGNWPCAASNSSMPCGGAAAAVGGRAGQSRTALGGRLRRPGGGRRPQRSVHQAAAGGPEAWPTSWPRWRSWRPGSSGCWNRERSPEADARRGRLISRRGGNPPPSASRQGDRSCPRR